MTKKIALLGLVIAVGAMVAGLLVTTSPTSYGVSLDRESCPHARGSAGRILICQEGPYGDETCEYRDGPSTCESLI